MDTKTDTNPPILCVRCKGAGANVYGGGVWSHHFWRDCIEHLPARAEAAEARVAELEAQLAAQGWRPGSETPAPDWYQTAETIDGVFSHAYFDGAVWQGYPDNYPPMWYRPIPPLPPAPNVQEPTP